MSKFIVELGLEATERLKSRAEENGNTPEEEAAEILNLMLVRPHNMNEESMKKGFEDTALIDLDWAEFMNPSKG